MTNFKEIWWLSYFPKKNNNNKNRHSFFGHFGETFGLDGLDGPRRSAERPKSWRLCIWRSARTFGVRRPKFLTSRFSLFGVAIFGQLNSASVVFCVFVFGDGNGANLKWNSSITDVWCADYNRFFKLRWLRLVSPHSTHWIFSIFDPKATSMILSWIWWKNAVVQAG